MHAPAPPRSGGHVRTALLAGAVTVLVTMLVGGCSGAPSGTPSAPPPLRHFTTLGELGQAAGAQMRLDKTAKITITGGASGGQVQASTTGEGVLRYEQAGPSLQLNERVVPNGSPSPTELGLIVLPDQAYVKPPANIGLSMPPGKSWLQVRQGATDPVSQQFGQLVRSVRDNADPTQSFSQFGDAASIAETADDTLDSVPTVRYKIHVDIAKAAERQPDPALKQALQDSAQKGMTSVDSMLWVDARNRPLRVLLQQPLPSGQGVFTVDARYRDWGQPVQITAPPADQVVPS